MFDPGKPDGNNQSLKIGISNDGTPKLNFTYKIPARCGLAVKLKINQIIEIENRSGTQVCDFWAFNSENLHEHLSMEHLHTSLGGILPKNGDSLV